MRRLFASASLALLFLFGACAQADEREAAIETQDGAVHRFTVELALTPDEQRKGLMYREELADDSGMLFFYPACAPAHFWMMNTLIPLDMIFIEADGRIARIAEMTVPETLDVHESGVPVNGVLEVKGGLTRRLGIGEGDFVRHPWFGEGGKATCG